MNAPMILVKYGYFAKSSAHADAFLFVDLINKTNLPKQTKATAKENTESREHKLKENRELPKHILAGEQSSAKQEERKEEGNRNNNKESRCIKANAGDGTTLWKMVWRIFAESLNSDEFKPKRFRFQLELSTAFYTYIHFALLYIIIYTTHLLHWCQQHHISLFWLHI